MPKKTALIAGLIASACSGLAQPVQGLTARITTVTEGGREGRFKVPQINCADAVVARRINRRIVWLIMSGETNAALSVSQQLRQAERTCCYDTENGLGWNTVGHGLTGCDYNVMLNQQGLLSLEYAQEFTGAYLWERAAYATFDLRTGRQLKLADLIADSPVQLTRRMHAAISRRFGESLAEMAASETDSADISFVAERFCWDWKAKRVRFQSDPSPLLEDRAIEPDLESFAITPNELQLHYERVLPHVVQNLEPDNTYHFPFIRLQPRGMLLPLVKTRPTKRNN